MVQCCFCALYRVEKKLFTADTYSGKDSKLIFPGHARFIFNSSEVSHRNALQSLGLQK